MRITTNTVYGIWIILLIVGAVGFYKAFPSLGEGWVRAEGLHIVGGQWEGKHHVSYNEGDFITVTLGWRPGVVGEYQEVPIDSVEVWFNQALRMERERRERE